MRALLATARVHSPLFTLRGGTNEVLRGVVRQGHGRAMSDELTQLVDDIGRRSFDARLGHRGFPTTFDDALWRHLEDTGLARLTSSQAAGPAEAAIVLSGLARHAAAVPIAETDLLAAWLAGKAGVAVPDSGPLTVAIADAADRDGRIVGDRRRRAMAAVGPVVLAARTADALHVAVVDEARRWSTGTTSPANRADRSRSICAVDGIACRCAARRRRTRPPRRVGPLRPDRRCARRGRASSPSPIPVSACSSARPLNKFQAVQHSLAAMAGEIERARAATALAVAAATDYGFDTVATDYAVTVAKVAVGRAVESGDHHRAPTARGHRRHASSTGCGWPPCGREAGSTSSARTAQHARDGSAGWRWRPTIRGIVVVSYPAPR